MVTKCSGRKTVTLIPQRNHRDDTEVGSCFLPLAAAGRRIEPWYFERHCPRSFVDGCFMANT